MKGVTPSAGLHLAAYPTLLLVLATSACGAGWHRPARLPPGPLPPRQQVQVWRRGDVMRWHAVHLATDSVSGVPFLRPVDCDSCRVALPRAGVDSIRLGNPVAGFWKTIGLVNLPGLLLIGYCLVYGCGFD